MNAKLISGAALALALGACATMPQPNAALESARAAVQTAEADPNVAKYAPLDLDRARKELGVAEDLVPQLVAFVREDHEARAGLLDALVSQMSVEAPGQRLQAFEALSRDDFLRVLTEPKHALTKQYAELLRTEGVHLEFTRDGIEAIADIAFEVNRTAQNIGARRLHTILERVVEEICYEAPEIETKRVRIDGKQVQQRLGSILEKEDLTRFIL